MSLKSTPSFDQAYRQLIRRYPVLQSKINKTLRQLEQNIYKRLDLTNT